MADISAGLAYSVIKNALFKVIKITRCRLTWATHVVVQGGTFYNDAVLQKLRAASPDCEAVRPDIAGIMGAFGAALIAQGTLRHESAESGLDPCSPLDKIVSDLDYYHLHDARCKGCTQPLRADHQPVSAAAAASSPATAASAVCGIEKSSRRRFPTSSTISTTAMFDYEPPARQDRRTRGDSGHSTACSTCTRTTRSGHVFFKKLGFRVVLSPQSTRQLYELGIESIPSESECYPAKLVHGHIQWLHQAGHQDSFSTPAFPTSAMSPRMRATTTTAPWSRPTRRTSRTTWRSWRSATSAS